MLVYVKGVTEKMSNFFANFFPWVIVALFIGASVASFWGDNYIKAGFYFTSALINIFTIYM